MLVVPIFLAQKLYFLFRMLVWMLWGHLDLFANDCNVPSYFFRHLCTCCLLVLYLLAVCIIVMFYCIFYNLLPKFHFFCYTYFHRKPFSDNFVCAKLIYQMAFYFFIFLSHIYYLLTIFIFMDAFSLEV